MKDEKGKCYIHSQKLYGLLQSRISPYNIQNRWQSMQTHSYNILHTKLEMNADTYGKYMKGNKY